VSGSTATGRKRWFLADLGSCTFADHNFGTLITIDWFE